MLEFFGMSLFTLGLIAFLTAMGLIIWQLVVEFNLRPITYDQLRLAALGNGLTADQISTLSDNQIRRLNFSLDEIEKSQRQNAAEAALASDMGPPRSPRSRSRSPDRRRDRYTVSKSKSKRNDDVVVVHAIVPKGGPQRAPRKRALLIGINYTGSKNELEGCQNDAMNVSKVIQSHYGYQAADITVMTDSTQTKPTRVNMLQAMKNLVADAQDGDSLYLHYSGHGSYIVDNTQESGQDDTLVPLDFESNGMIMDSTMHEILIVPLVGKKVKFTSVFDACHSGTALDLKFNWDCNKDDGFTIQNWVGKHERGDDVDAQLWSGCLDSQTSEDVRQDKKAYGAFTDAYLHVLEKYHYKLTVGQMLGSISRQLVSEQISQTPQLSATKLLNMNSSFSLAYGDS